MNGLRTLCLVAELLVGLGTHAQTLPNWGDQGKACFDAFDYQILK